MQTYLVEMKPLGDSTIEDIASTLPTDMKWEAAEPTGEYQNLRVTVEEDQIEKFANWLNVEVDELTQYEEKES
jgi:hypothetical protein